MDEKTLKEIFGENWQKCPDCHARYDSEIVTHEAKDCVARLKRLEENRLNAQRETTASFLQRISRRSGSVHFSGAPPSAEGHPCIKVEIRLYPDPENPDRYEKEFFILDMDFCFMKPEVLMYCLSDFTKEAETKLKSQEKPIKLP